jgi:hypothetical protein
MNDDDFRLVLDAVTGVITTGRVVNGSALDRELSSVYHLTVEAQDNAGRGNRLGDKF